MFASFSARSQGRKRPTENGGPGRVKSQPALPLTLGGAAAAGVRLIVWCSDCRHKLEPDPAESRREVGHRNRGARLAREADVHAMR